MKTNLFSCTMMIVAGVAFAACSKQDSTESGAATADSAEASLEAANAEAEKQSTQVTAETESATAEIKAQTEAATSQAITAATTATATTTAQAQSVIEKAQAYVAEKKYTEALDTLSQIANVKLTSEQQDLVNKLKAQIQTAMASQGANEGLKAVGGILEKK